MQRAGFSKFDGGKSSVRFKRPPRSLREAINTLKEADQRYEKSKSALIGRNRRSINHADFEKLYEEKE